MKKQKHFWATSLFLFSFLAIVNFTRAQVPEGTKTILMRTYESPSGLISSQIIISYGENKGETIELETDNKKNALENLGKINKVITRIEDQGFELITSHAILVYGANATTYVFRKSK
jgi:hypothetical protein